MQGTGQQRTALVPDRRTRLGEGFLQRDALAVLLGQTSQQADLAGQAPEDHRRLDAFAAQSFQDAQGVGRFTAKGSVDQAEDIEACAVGDRGLYGGGVDLVALGEQLELFDFLGGGEQVAFHARGDQLQGFGAGGQAGLGQALANPLRQLVDVDRPDLDELRGVAIDQGLGPLGLLRAAIELGQAEQEHGVFRRPLQVFLENRRAFVAGLAGGQAQFDQALLGEQRQAGAGLQQQAPIEVGFGIEYLALAEVALAAGLANGIAGFLAEQRFIAADDIDGRQGALEVLGELRGSQLHRRRRGR